MSLPGQHPLDNSVPEARLLARINALEKRIAALERHPQIPVSSGAPGTGATGQLTVDRSDPRIWVNIDGTWKSVVVS